MSKSPQIRMHVRCEEIHSDISRFSLDMKERELL